MKTTPSRRRKTHSDIQLVDAFAIHPSEENDQLYRPVDPEDPEIIALADSIRRFGLREPLVITLDGFILSGHRRHVAARLAGMTTVPCRIEPIRRGEDIDQFIRLLREYNRQRVKSFDEQLREEAVSVDPEDAYQALITQRVQKSDMSDFSDDTLAIGEHRQRRRISSAKRPMLEAARQIVMSRRHFWPLSVRQVHYALLNDPPLKHAGKPGSAYANNLKSYKDLCDLLTRARLERLIPWQAIADETRPFIEWAVHREPGGFLREQMDDLLKGYRRDLQQSQPNHIEIVAEKLTVRSIVESVAGRYSIPVTIGRGYCSIDPRRALAQRFHRSGREKLVVLLVSDFDPDGEQIAQSFARSMRDDFGIEPVAIKAALTAEQVKKYQLPKSMDAKPGSSNYRRFVAQYGVDAYELEALEPTLLQEILQERIDSILDVEAFNAELEAEREDAAKLEAARRAIAATMSDITL